MRIKEPRKMGSDIPNSIFDLSFYRLRQEHNEPWAWIDAGSAEEWTALEQYLGIPAVKERKLARLRKWVESENRKQEVTMFTVLVFVTMTPIGRTSDGRIVFVVFEALVSRDQADTQMRVAICPDSAKEQLARHMKDREVSPEAVRFLLTQRIGKPN